jgi:transposase
MRQVEKLFNSMLTTVRENKRYTKKIIVRLYKEDYQTPEIARKTNHTLEACDRYIKAYKRVEKLNTKMSIDEIAQTLGMGKSLAKEYLNLIDDKEVK